MSRAIVGLLENHVEQAEIYPFCINCQGAITNQSKMALAERGVLSQHPSYIFIWDFHLSHFYTQCMEDVGLFPVGLGG